MTTTGSTLGDVKRKAAMDHIVAEARMLVMTTGIGVTMDQLADATGVSRRTLFRLFGSREQLIAAAFALAAKSFEQAMPAYDGDPDQWLKALCDTVHQLNAPAGPGYWELSLRADLPPDLAALEQSRRRDRRQWIASTTRVLWRAHGGSGDPPSELVSTVGAHLSAHFTAAVATDVGQGWAVASGLARDAISDAIARALRGSLPG